MKKAPYGGHLPPFWNILALITFCGICMYILVQGLTEYAAQSAIP